MKWRKPLNRRDRGLSSKPIDNASGQEKLTGKRIFKAYGRPNQGRTADPFFLIREETLTFQRKSWFLTVSFIFCMLIMTAAPSIGADRIIIGGKRVGPVTLGAPLSKYASYLGNRKMISPTFFNYPKRGMALLVKNGKVEGIMVYSTDYKTRKGVRVGTPLAKVRKHYGNYLRTESGSLTYSELGLSFNESGNKVTRIMVVHAAVDPLLGDKAVIPGVRAGNLKIGMDVSAVKKYWGEPTKTRQLENNKSVTIYQYDPKAVKLLVTDGVVAGVQVNSYKFRTPEGIGIDSTREQVVKTYGKQFKKVKDSVMYPSMGVGFYFHKNKVIEILLTYRRR